MKKNYSTIPTGSSSIQIQQQNDLYNSLWMNSSLKQNPSMVPDYTKTKLCPYLTEV